MFAEPIIGFSGFVIGFFLNKFVKEELEIGKKYFALLSIMLLASLFFLIEADISLIIGFLGGILLSLILKNVYFYLGLLITSIALFQESIVIVSSLIFVFGLSYAALNHSMLKKKLIIISFVLFFIPFLLLLQMRIIGSYYSIFQGIAAGGIVKYIIEIIKEKIQKR
ncbi:hypothetical protein HY500_03800 [Candidatus Woesearchaeota archaeon]|nr:hypothetical protein [Candidatus Woesearchaeota archaeon]